MRTYEISDWKEEGNLVAFLFRMTDRSVADPYFSDIEKDERRKAAKVEREGQESSSHVVIQLPENPVDPAIMLIERTSGITIPRVLMVLKLLLKKAKIKEPELFKQPPLDGAVVDGKPVMHDVNYWLDAEGHISDQLAEDLNKGSISEIELITKRHREEPFDQDAYLVNEESIVVLKVNKKHQGYKDKFKKITGLLEEQKDFEKARIRFVTAGGTTGNIDWDEENGISEQYLKKELIKNIQPPMESSYEVFRKDLLINMRLLIKI
ncbi:hypothetical protein EAH83_01875 [Variovorax ginsengisoli]|uniref:DUF4747 family protein n=1 Tax=Variovorax guangxiensis TaxID=1775474 RepID=A0A502E028_9BURK|nr:hypothetical protein EAH83_01875 [Variovorax ginsengisoli]TPG30269.1 hypothetical protein EAH82_01875 [Variovorax guangxiensis]